MTHAFRSGAFAAILLVVFSGRLQGDGAPKPALIVWDGAGGISTSISTNLSAKLTDAGFTVTTNVGVPGGSLASYLQIWDVRYNFTTPLSPSDITAYLAYLSGGGSLFVMGENSGFIVRDNSIISLIQQAGGGTITLTSPSGSQIVQPPFTGPNALATITILAGAGTTNPGRGAFIMKDANNAGIGIVYSPGSLTNAPSGSLLVVFDVNFLDTSADANSQNLTRNLIEFLASPVAIPPAVPPVAAPVGTPTLSEWAMILMAAGLMFVAARRIRASPERSSR